MIIAPQELFEESLLKIPEQSLPLSQRSYLQIRKMIVTIDLPPGTILDENRLIQELDLGRTPIREALQRLSWEKLVNIVPRRGIFVSDIGITDLQRLFEMRTNLEILAARLASQRGTEEHWRLMENALSSFSNQEEPQDAKKIIIIDEFCHQIIYRATDNKFLRDTLEALYALCLRLWFYFLPRLGDQVGLIVQHRKVLKAMRAKDIQGASDLLERHVLEFQNDLQKAMINTLISS